MDLIESESRAPGLPKPPSACSVASRKAREAIITEQTLDIIESSVHLGMRANLRSYLASQLDWHCIDVFFAGRADALEERK